MLNTLRVTLTDLIVDKVTGIFAKQQELARKAAAPRNRKPLLFVEEVETRIAPGTYLYR